MKLTIERAALLTSLQHVQSVVERRNTIPILSNILVAADDADVSLTATDMELTVVDHAPAQVATAGSVTAPAHMMYEIVRKLPDGADITLSSDAESDRLLVHSGRSRFTLLCLPTEDFPSASDGDLPHNFALPAADLRELIDKTRFAISTEETRYYLNGIYLHAPEDNAGSLRAVATDGHRLARVDVGRPEGAEGMPGIIVPRKAVGEMRKLIDNVDEPVAVALSDTRIRFAVNGSVLTSKLIDGTFPEYQRVIPSGNDKVMTVHGKAFAEAVDRVSTIATDKLRAVKMAVETGKLTLSASSPEQATATEELAVEFENDALEIGFNSRYVLEMAQQLDGENIVFEMSDAVSPTLVSDAADSRTLYVLMPMRV